MNLSNREISTMNPLTIEEKNEICVKIAGISKNGRVFGLGSIQNVVSMSLDDVPVPPQSTEEVETFTLQMKKLESELQKSLDVNVLIEKRLGTMEGIIQSLASQNGMNTVDASTCGNVDFSTSFYSTCGNVNFSISFYSNRRFLHKLTWVCSSFASIA